VLNRDSGPRHLVRSELPLSTWDDLPENIADLRCSINFVYVLCSLSFN
jgi:hypothetical protein